MSQESLAKVKCKNIDQIAIAVENLEVTAMNYWNILGIGPWSIFEWEGPTVYDRMYHGKKIWARERIALVQVGNVELELVQPVEGNSLYRDWLDEHGESIHHINFHVDDVDETSELFTSQGFSSIQSGKFGIPEYRGGFNYIDTWPLRCIWEPVHEPEVKDLEPIMFPDVSKESPAKVKCTNINQIGLVVRDVETVARNYWNIMGIGPWSIFDWELPNVYDRTYHGKTVWAREKIATTQVGNVQLELMQPVEGNSIYQDWLEEHGEGLHHINFLVDDRDATAELLTSEGFPSIQSGRYGPEEQKGGFNYIDVKPLAAIWEVVHRPREKGFAPVMFPPQD